MTLSPHSPAWYDRLATLQKGYSYPWKSILPPFNGEDTYLEMVRQHLTPDSVVLDAGCGHGEVALDLAPHCRHILAYDRVPAYIELAQQAAEARGIKNVTFVPGDSSSEANGGRPRIPTERDDFTLLISRRGPLNWLLDARRIARPGAVLIQLNPELTPPPPWNDRLPPEFQIPPLPNWTMHDAVKNRLAEAGLRIHSCWTFDVPEYFPDARQLYLRQTFGMTPEEAPSFESVRERLEALFREFAAPEGLELRHRRFLWKAVVPGS